MKIKSFTLKFIALGKDKKTYLRYYVTGSGKPMTKNIDCKMLLTPDQIKALNEGTLGGTIQKAAYQTRNRYMQIIETLNVRDNSYPTPQDIDDYFNLTEKALAIDYYINQYFHQLRRTAKTKETYGYALKEFKTYFNLNLQDKSIREIINKNTLLNFENHIIQYRIVAKKKPLTLVTIHNIKAMVLMFLNYLASEYNIPEIELELHMPASSSKYNLTPEDIQKLLSYNTKLKTKNEVLDIIRINQYIGLRISEILGLLKDNVVFQSDGTVGIKFNEFKKKKERTIIIVNQDAINIINEHLHADKSEKLFGINNYHTFTQALKKIAKDVFKEETIKLYTVNTSINDYQTVKKCDAISSHTFRRFAIQQNIVKYGIDVARTFSGHTDYQTITKHYADYINKKDLKGKLLKNQ